MKAHIGVDADSGIVHSIAITGANVTDISMADDLIRDNDDLIRDNDDTVLTDAGYQGLEKYEKTKGKAVLVAMRPGKRKLLSKNSILSQIEYLKSQVRAKVEHPFHWLINLCQNKKLLINSGA